MCVKVKRNTSIIYDVERGCITFPHDANIVEKIELLMKTTDVAKLIMAELAEELLTKLQTNTDATP